MDTNTLKVFAGHYIKESDINEEEKLELIDAVKIAERGDILSLLTFGEFTTITSENLNIVDDTEVYIEGIVKSAVKDIRKTGRHAKGVWKGAMDSAKAGQAGDELGKTLGQVRADIHAYHGSRTKTSKALMGAGAATGAYLLYRKYMSKAAKFCKGKAGDEKKQCLKAYRAKAPKKK